MYPVGTFDSEDEEGIDYIQEHKNNCKEYHIKYDYTYVRKVCINCGLIIDKFEIENLNTEEEDLNPLYNNGTHMSYNHKYKNINRLHKWKNKEEIKEMNANNRYTEINNIIYTYFKNINNITKKILSKKCSYLYKDIYINNNICSRGKIRFCNYIYCIYKICLNMNIDINIFDMLKENKLTITNFNNSLNNMEDKYYIHKDIEKYRKIINNNYNEISLNKFIEQYNIILQKSKKRFKKINYTNIIVGTIISLINDKNIVRFCEIFKIKEKTYNYGYDLFQN